MFEDDDDFKDMKSKIKDFLKEKSLELKGFVEETMEINKEYSKEVIAEVETEESATVELAESDSDYELEDMITDNELNID